jgi:hypothetical protein
MNKWLWGLALVFGLASCSVTAPVNPTNPPTPPTSLLQPTGLSTSLPPTTMTIIPLIIPPSTPFVQTTPFPTPSAIVGAYAKTRAAKTYRVAMTFNAKQGAAPAFTLDLKGEISGDNVHYAYKLGSEQIELTALNGQFYAKGAKSVGLPTTTKWYIITPDLADAVNPPLSPDETLDEFVAQTSRLAFQPAARESFDGQNCQVWRYVPKSLGETGVAQTLAADPDNSAYGAIDQAELKVWICDDGALHQFTVDLSAHNPKQATDKGNAKLVLHLWDLGNATIKIDPPPNAEPFKLGKP